MKVFQDYAYYYNLFYQDKDYRMEAKQIDMLLTKYGNQVKHILNFGCGTGKHDLELANMGYQCTGVDKSWIMIEIAQENAAKMEKNIEFEVADICNYQSDKEYDAVISLFHVMSYQNTNEGLLKAFRSARKALKSDGVFLFDGWYGPGVLTDKPVVRVKEIHTDRYRLVRIAKPVMHDTDNIVDVCYEVFVIDNESNETKSIVETHNMRYFFRPELEFYLRESGFELIDNMDCKTLEKTDYNSWTSFFVARAV